MTSLLKNLFSRYINKIFVFLVLLFLAYFIANNYDDLLKYLNKINWTVAIFSGLTHLLAMITQTIGWYCLSSQISQNKNFLPHSRIYTSSLVARRIPLGMVWSIGGRFSQYKNNLSKKEFSMLIFCEYVLIGGAGGILIFFILLFCPNLVPTSLRFGLIILLFIQIILLAGSALLSSISLPLPPHIEKVKNILSLFPLNTLLSSFFSFLITWILDGISLYLLLISLDIYNNLLIVFGIAWLSAFSSFWGQFLPLNTAYRELTLTLLLSQWTSITMSLFVAIFQRVIYTLIEILLAIVLDKI